MLEVINLFVRFAIAASEYFVTNNNPPFKDDFIFQRFNDLVSSFITLDTNVRETNPKVLNEGLLNDFEAFFLSFELFNTLISQFDAYGDRSIIDEDVYNKYLDCVNQYSQYVSNLTSKFNEGKV